MINRSYTNKSLELVSSKPTTTSMKEKEIDNYASAKTSDLNKIHKLQ